MANKTKLVFNPITGQFDTVISQLDAQNVIVDDEGTPVNLQEFLENQPQSIDGGSPEDVFAPGDIFDGGSP